MHSYFRRYNLDHGWCHRLDNPGSKISTTFQLAFNTPMPTYQRMFITPMPTITNMILIIATVTVIKTSTATKPNTATKTAIKVATEPPPNMHAHIVAAALPPLHPAATLSRVSPRPPQHAASTPVCRPLPQCCHTVAAPPPPEVKCPPSCQRHKFS